MKQQPPTNTIKIRLWGNPADVAQATLKLRDSFVLVNYRRLGWNEARLLENFPTLRAVDLVNAWAYADAHPAEIEQAIVGNEAA